MSLKDEALQRLTLQSLAARDQYAFNLVLGQINQPGPRSNVLSALFLVSEDVLDSAAPPRIAARSFVERREVARGHSRSRF